MDLFEILANLINLALVVVSVVLAGSVCVWLWRSGGRSPGLAVAGGLATLLMMLVFIRPAIVDRIKEPAPAVTQYPARSNPYGQ